MATNSHRLREAFGAIFRWRSLKTRLLVLTLVTFLLGLWSLVFYANQVLKGDLENLLYDQQFATVSFIAEEVNAEFSARVEALQTIAAKITPAMLSNPKALQAMLEDQPIFYSLFNNGVAVAGLDGTVIAEFPHLPKRLGANFSERDYVIGPLREGTVTFGRPVMSKLMHAPAFVIGTPIHDKQGKVIGVIGGVTDLRLPNYLDQVTEQRYGKTGGYLLLIPQERLIVTATDKSRVMKTLPAPGVNPQLDRFLQGYDGSAVFVNPEGIEVIASGKNIPVSGWRLAALLPTEEAFSPIRKMLFHGQLAAVFLTLLIGGLLWWILRRQLAPMFATVKTLATLSDTKTPLVVTRKDEIGELIGGFNRLLETLRQEEEATKQSEERYRTIIEDIEDGYNEVDLHGNFTFFNEPMRRMLGYAREELLGMNNRQYADAENAQKAYQAYNQVYRTGKSIKNFEWQVIRKDGSRRDVEVSISLIRDNKEQPTGFRGIARDITERKKTEEEKRSLVERLQRAEKMESLGTLAGGVAHDLNNVLGVIVGYSELLLESVDKASPLRHSLENVMKGGMKAAAIVDDLLTLARRGVQGRTILNLNKIIADCQQSPEFANLSAHHPAVTIETDLEPDLLNISGSSVHLGKSLYNLLSNAGEAMPKGGIVAIKTTNQYLDKPLHGYDQIREGDYVVLSVSDTGQGIEEKDLKRIFEPFYTKKIMGRSGTGLGLAVVWGTVKDHNGYINVQSEAGKGSVFTLYFPVTREEITTEAAAAAISEYMGKGETILVVDDVKEQRELASNMLRTLNYQVISAAGGEEAVDYLKGREVDLLVLDMIMDPGMDGLETYRQVIEIHPRQKAIIVSGFSESDRVKVAAGLGAAAYVRKPYIKEKLGLAVRKAMDIKQAAEKQK
ncbi:MAG: PAS domain S-box protein [Syntrophales bacterium]